MANFTREEIEDIVHKLERASLAGTNLSNANLSDADLSKADLSVAKHRTTPTQSGPKAPTLWLGELCRLSREVC